MATKKIKVISCDRCSRDISEDPRLELGIAAVTGKRGRKPTEKYDICAPCGEELLLFMAGGKISKKKVTKKLTEEAAAK